MMNFLLFFFFKQKTAYEMRISDWSSDVCSSDLLPCTDDDDMRRGKPTVHRQFDEATAVLVGDSLQSLAFEVLGSEQTHKDPFVRAELVLALARAAGPSGMAGGQMRSEELTAELQSLMRNSYAVFWLKKNKNNK